MKVRFMRMRLAERKRKAVKMKVNRRIGLES